MAIGHPAFLNTTRNAAALLAIVLLSACSTTSGSTRIDETGERIADQTSYEPESSAYYIKAMNGGLISRVGGLKLSAADRARALEAEYKALEVAPSGHIVSWQGSGVSGSVTAAVPYQVGSQNCRQYTQSVTTRNAATPLLARGAACRNTNGSWTPL